MTLKIQNGDYVIENGKAVTLENEQEIIQWMKQAVECKKGAFYADKNYGRRAPLTDLVDCLSSDVAAGLMNMPYACVLRANKDGDSLDVTVIIDKKQRGFEAKYDI